MDRNNKLLEIFAEVLDVELESLTLESSIDDVEEWDSLGMVEVIGEIEAVFQCQIPFEEVETITQIKDFLKYL